MKTISLKELKEDLSKWAEIVAKGESVSVTKYNKPYFQLVPPWSASVIVGSKVGQDPIKPVMKKSHQGSVLDLLEEDREESHRKSDK